MDSFMQDLESWPTDAFNYSSMPADEVFTPGLQQMSTSLSSAADAFHARNISMQMMEKLELNDSWVEGSSGNGRKRGSMDLLEPIPEARSSMRHLDAITV